VRQAAGLATRRRRLRRLRSQLLLQPRLERRALLRQRVCLAALPQLLRRQRVRAREQIALERFDLAVNGRAAALQRAHSMVEEGLGLRLVLENKLVPRRKRLLHVRVGLPLVRMRLPLVRMRLPLVRIGLLAVHTLQHQRQRRLLPRVCRTNRVGAHRDCVGMSDDVAQS